MTEKEEKISKTAERKTKSPCAECPKNKKKQTENEKNIYPVLPLRDIVVFPHMIVPLFVGREKSVNALDSVVNGDKQILLVSQKDSAVDNPKSDDLNRTGTLSTVLQLLRLPDGTVKVLIEGIKRAKIEEFITETPYFQAHVSDYPDEENAEKEQDLNALFLTVKTQFESYVRLNKRISPEALVSVSQMKSPEMLADAVASHLSIKLAEKQRILELPSLAERLEALFEAMENEINVLQVESKIRRRVKRQMEKTQREYYLNEQMKAIQKELGDGNEYSDVQELEKKVDKARMPKEAREKAKGELKKLSMMGAMSAEAGIIRGYVEWLASLPWRSRPMQDIDLKKAQEILDKDHYGLEKVKDRIIEYLAVQKKSRSNKGPILCLVGPPGVGKTSLGQSIAKATGRTFVRASLGGMRDEAEIRGHRRTYIGAMPGKIIQSMKKAKTLNTLFLLDEIDKLGADWRGDPSSALLEVLDPEQNTTFNDHYLEVDYNLSPVMFVTTANTLKMPKPLLDRMEIIQLSGYTEDEKVQIALRHLLPKQMKIASLKEDEFSVTESAVRKLIQEYTREAGVRSLEREIANLARKAVKELMLNEDKKTVAIDEKNLADFAGVPRYSYGLAEKEDQIGTVTGLAWTEVGGEILSIEAVLMPGKGNILLTGQLGDVMKESAEAARSYIRSHASRFGIPDSVFEKNDLHVHVPEGATPKDGPSAGIAICTALVSAMTGIAVKKEVAMTGEITLRGKVLPIGGLKEKLLAALRGGLKTVLIPKENVKDLSEIPENVKGGLEIIPVEDVTEVLDKALTGTPTPIPVETALLESKEQTSARPN